MFYFDKKTGVYGQSDDLVILTEDNVTRQWVQEFLDAQSDRERAELVHSALENGSGHNIFNKETKKIADPERCDNQHDTADEMFTCKDLHYE